VEAVIRSSVHVGQVIRARTNGAQAVPSSQDHRKSWSCPEWKCNFVFIGAMARATAHGDAAALWTAAQTGDVDSVRRALVPVKGNAGMHSYVAHAKRRRDDAPSPQYFEQGFDHDWPYEHKQESDEVSGEDGPKDAALVVAAANDYSAAVQVLLQAKANVSGCKSGLTPLHAAVKCGALTSSSPTLALLLEAGASVNLAVRGVTPVLIAARTADAASLALLLGARACVRTAHFAARRRHLLLLDAPIQACETHPHLLGEAVQSLRLLLGECPWLVENEWGENTAVLSALRLPDPTLLETLLDAKAATNGSGRFQPLYHAVVAERLRSVHVLASRGARVLTDTVSTSPVHVAFQRGYDAGLRVLLSHVDVGSLRTDSGHTLLHWAAVHGRTDTVRTLLEAKAVPEITTDAVRHLGVLALLLKAKADPNRTACDGSRLCVAVSMRNVEALHLLLSAKADPNGHVARYGFLPLTLAAGQRGSAGLVRTLLQAKARVNATSSNLRNQTALHEAVRACNVPVVQLLLDAGADVHMQDLLGNFPHNYAPPHEAALRRMLFAHT
jgi:ankyrin repeat protein